MQSLSSPNQFEDLLDRSHEQPVLIYKHSSRCPLSSQARDGVATFEEQSDLSIFEVVVQTDRATSDHVADALETRHEIPQVILVRDGHPVHEAFHTDVTVSALQRAAKCPAH
jgi:bacillithiol system protein YtxJ